MRTSEQVTLYLEGNIDPDVLTNFCEECGTDAGIWCATFTVSAPSYLLMGVVHTSRFGNGYAATGLIEEDEQ